MKVEVVEGIADLPADAWNRLGVAEYPFLQHQFLLSGETSGCVSPDAGWTPCHLALWDTDGRLRAAMPLYEKTHSWGEFVFDWAWAQAYSRAGLDYYPKLVSAAPFTPARSPRLLRRDPADREAGLAMARAAIELAKERGHSSLHVQFPLDDELDLLREAGCMLRKDCQFHWQNRNYEDFDEFLAGFSSSKRKKARRDRRRVAEQGITFRRLHGDDLDERQWREVYDLISVTFLRRGSTPYFSYEFFCEVAQQLPGKILAIVAEHAGRKIAAAVFFRGDNALYGRYWGADADYNALHFETCYYQGIDYCIEHNLKVFEPGTQGEHKISRGFIPVTTWSAHWLARPEFFAAVSDYLDSESQHIDNYIEVVREHTPYRRDPDSSNATSKDP